MSELQIRINKRTLERALALLIIIVLAVLLVNQSGGEVNTEELESLQAQVANLTAQNEALTSEVSTLETQLSNAQEEISTLEETDPEPAPEPETDPEPELSGELSFNYEASTNDGALNAFAIEIQNGLENSQELSLRVSWQGGDLSEVYRLRDAVVGSGESETIIIDDLPSNPGEGVDTIRVVVRDAEDALIEQEYVEVF